MAGGVYVPVNDNYPELRRRFIIEDAACKYVLSNQDTHAINRLSLSVEMPCMPVNYSIAYILYTSGTTGKPKGVVVGHEALLNKLQAELESLSFNTGIRSCLLTNYSFDVSLLELLLPLLSGGTIIIPQQAIMLEPEKLAALLIKEKVNLLQGTPTFIESLFRYLPDDLLSELNKELQAVCIGGESLNKNLVHFLSTKLPAIAIHNHYGPTETVIDAVVSKNIKHFDKNIIGRPLLNVKSYVLDEQLQWLPPGVIGELYIGGVYLAEEYINNPAENGARFVNNPFVAGERLFKSGDLVKWSAEGELEFIGRKDEQIKIQMQEIEIACSFLYPIEKFRSI
jgi:amino acid adenylation domain-containing protein